MCACCARAVSMVVKLKLACVGTRMAAFYLALAGYLNTPVILWRKPNCLNWNVPNSLYYRSLSE